MKIGELAGRTGLNASAIRYYERMGLLAPPHRTGGQRRYPQEATCRVLLIRFAGDMGFTLAEIKIFLSGLRDNSPVGPRWRKLATHKIKDAERTIEREHVPGARQLGMGICPWGPLASGFPAGKYTRDKGADSIHGSWLEVLKNANNPAFKKFSERNWRVLEVLLTVAKALDRPAAQVALNWVATQPGVTSTIIGATKLAHLEDNLASLSFDLPAELRARLDEVSQLDPAHPYMFFEAYCRSASTAGSGCGGAVDQRQLRAAHQDNKPGQFCPGLLLFAEDCALTSRFWHRAISFTAKWFSEFFCHLAAGLTAATGEPAPTS